MTLHRPFIAALAAAVTSLIVAAPALLAEEVLLSEVVNIRQAEFEYGRPVLNKTTKNEPLRIAGKTFEKGVGTETDTTLLIALKGASRFTALVGLDDATKAGTEISVEVQLDGKSVWRKNLKAGQPPETIELDVQGKKELALIGSDLGNEITHALLNWVDAKFVYAGDKPAPLPVPTFVEQAVVLTPKPSPQPRINGARVFGVRPGNPFFFQIPATGQRPMSFAADRLPPGLSVNKDTGLITGKIEKAGTHEVLLRATNALGKDEKKLRIAVGEELALTPPMGWNSWNCWGPEVDAEKVRRSARAMVDKGLVQHGWSYVNIDDAWQAPDRGGPHHAIQPNQKFANLKGLVDEIHAMGLKVGIYSTPWDTSYAGYIGGSSDNPEGKWSADMVSEGGRRRRHQGKISFAENDAKQWAEWGIDYLKYDWNPKSTSPQETAEEFTNYVATMGRALRASGRDMVYSYSNSMPFEWVAEQAKVLNAWRTTGDIHDTWASMSRIGFGQDKWRSHAKPGHWNDPDMLVVGYVDVGRGKNLHPTRLTPNEQYTHISLWSLLAAPLLIGCDLERADEFTISLLTNDEVLAINQDELGKQAAQVVVDGRRQVWVRELSDGSRAIGFFNLHKQAQPIKATFAQLGLSGAQRVRDVWRQKDLPVAKDAFSFEVPRHGAVLIRVWPEKR